MEEIPLAANHLGCIRPIVNNGINSNVCKLRMISEP